MAVSKIHQDGFTYANTPNVASPMFTNVVGGCYKWGNMVLVSLGCYVNGSFPENDYFTVFTGLPIPNVQSSLAISTSSTKSNGATCAVLTDGSIRVDSGVVNLSYETIYITGVYMLS